MKINNEKVPFPIIGKLSFFKIVETLKESLNGQDEHLVKHATELLAEVTAVTELVEGTEDYSILEEHKELVDKMMRLIFPPALTLNEIKGASLPFSFSMFHQSQRMQNIMTAAGEDFSLNVIEIDPDLLYMMGCSTILQGYYGFPVNLSVPLVVQIPEKTGDLKYYRTAFNADLMEIVPTEHALEITKADYCELIDNFHDVDLWKKKFPPNSWVCRGIGLINFMDVTVDQSINMMTSNLLEGTPDAFDKVVENIRSLIRINDLAVSFTRYDNDKLFSVTKYRENNVLLYEKDELYLEDAFEATAKKILFEDHKAFIVSDVDEFEFDPNELIGQQLKKKKLESYILIPLEHDGGLMGFMEFSSPRKRELNSITFEKLKLALPILSMAVNRFKQEDSNKIEAIIQEQCTSIHPSVKWKFNNAAREYIDAEIMGEKPEFQDLVFNEVFPLYGQLDIKSSSALRNSAVKEDLSLQLKSVKKVLRKAIEEEPLPAYEEMLFRVDSYLSEFKTDLIEGTEQRILAFLRSDIYPIFDYLKQLSPAISKAIKEYKALLNPESNMIYDKRKDFDVSVNQVNSLLSELIDERQKTAQKMYPHYFERYNTDGLEFNLYIGQSISEKKKFNPIYLNNIHLWQLNSICELEHALFKLRKTLPMPLEVASLILVHSAALSIHFRVDEKRFDVEGAYNARYEIIKKRVDKAHIKGTQERLTVPGKIAIVYTNKEDAADYIKHIQYLIAKGYVLENSIEELELEDLQGVSGLKALRVSVDYTHAEDNINIEDLIQSFEK